MPILPPDAERNCSCCAKPMELVACEYPYWRHTGPDCERHGPEVPPHICPGEPDVDDDGNEYYTFVTGDAPAIRQKARDTQHAGAVLGA